MIFQWPKNISLWVSGTGQNILRLMKILVIVTAEKKIFPKLMNAIKKAIEINPKQYTAFTACINLFFEKKSYEKALEVIGEAHLNFPNNYELTAQEGNCYLMKGDTVNALKRYEKAYDFNPDKKIAQYISKKFFEIGDTLNALKYQNK